MNMMNDRVIVTEKCKNMRALARQALRGNWGKSFLIYLVFGLVLVIPLAIIVTICEAISGSSDLYSDTGTYADLITSWIPNLYSLLVGGPLTLGFSIFMISLFRKTGCRVSQLFSGFNQFGKAFGLYFMQQLFIFLWMLPVLIIWIIFFVIMGLRNHDYLYSVLGTSEPSFDVYVCMFLFLITIYAVAIFASLRYSQAFYLLVDDPNKGVMQCITESKLLMKGNMGKLFLLHLSFIGWIALLILVCVIIVVPIAFQIYDGDIAAVGLLVLLIVFMYIVIFVGAILIGAYIKVATVAFYDILTGRLRANPVEGFSQTEPYQSTVNHMPERSAIQDQTMPVQPPDQMSTESTIYGTGETQEEISPEGKNSDHGRDGFE